jgi:hypothetical protein
LPGALADWPVVVTKPLSWGWSEGAGSFVALFVRTPGFPGRSRVNTLTPDKPFVISKRAVWEAYEKVKANRGAPGVDKASLGAAFTTPVRSAR